MKEKKVFVRKVPNKDEYEVWIEGFDRDIKFYDPNKPKWAKSTPEWPSMTRKEAKKLIKNSK